MENKDFTDINNTSLEEYLKLDYYQRVFKYIDKKNVLDVGCVDDGLGKANEIRLWNHWFISIISKSSIGIDLRKQPLDQLKKLGYNVQLMDAQNIAFSQKFDVVFAGELIEHLPNPGLFLVSAGNALSRNGMIILSTPNPFSLSRLVRVFQSLTNEPPVNPDHTMYLSPQNIKTLSKKCGLRVIKIDYAHFPFTKNGILIRLNKLFCSFLGDKFKEQLLVFIKKDK